MSFPEFCDAHKRWYNISCDYCDAEDRKRMGRLAYTLALAMTEHFLRDHYNVPENECHHPWFVYGTKMNIHQVREVIHHIEREF